MAAYCQMVSFNFEEGFTSLIVPRATYTPAEFDFIRPYLTDKAAGLWDAAVKKAVRGNARARRAVETLTYFKFVSPEYRFDPKELRRGDRYGAASTLVDTSAGTKRLAIRFNIYTHLLLHRAGKAFTAPLKKDVTYWLVPNAGKAKPWLIDGWTATTTTGKIVPAS